LSHLIKRQEKPGFFLADGIRPAAARYVRDGKIKGTMRAVVWIMNYNLCSARV